MSPTPVLNQELEEEQDERSALSSLLDLTIRTTVEENRGWTGLSSLTTDFVLVFAALWTASRTLG